MTSKHRDMFWWEWICFFIACSAWVIGASFSIFWCVAAVMAESVPAAGLGGFALALLWFNNPSTFVVDEDAKHASNTATWRPFR